MINIVVSLIKSAAPIIQKGTVKVGKKLIGHFAKHGVKYLAGAGGGAAVGGAYVMGNKKGHTQGKKEGTAEQAQRDEVKFQKQHEQHEENHKKWNAEKQEYENLLNEAEDNWK